MIGAALAQAGDDYLVTVCASCLCASCWHGESMCWEAPDANIVEKRASELRALGLEHPENYSRQKLFEVVGAVTEVTPDGVPRAEIIDLFTALKAALNGGRQ